MEPRDHRLRSTWSYQKQEEVRNGLYPEFLDRGPGLADTLALNFWPPACAGRNCCGFKPPARKLVQACRGVDGGFRGCSLSSPGPSVGTVARGSAQHVTRNS